MDGQPLQIPHGVAYLCGTKDGYCSQHLYAIVSAAGGEQAPAKPAPTPKPPKEAMAPKASQSKRSAEPERPVLATVSDYDAIIGFDQDDDEDDAANRAWHKRRAARRAAAEAKPTNSTAHCS